MTEIHFIREICHSIFSKNIQSICLFGLFHLFQLSTFCSLLLTWVACHFFSSISFVVPNVCMHICILLAHLSDKRLKDVFSVDVSSVQVCVCAPCECIELSEWSTWMTSIVTLVIPLHSACNPYIGGFSQGNGKRQFSCTPMQKYTNRYHNHHYHHCHQPSQTIWLGYVPHTSMICIRSMLLDKLCFRMRYNVVGFTAQTCLPQTRSARKQHRQHTQVAHLKTKHGWWQ